MHGHRNVKPIRVQGLLEFCSKRGCLFSTFSYVGCCYCVLPTAEYEVGIMKILPIFCFKMSNCIEGFGGEGILNCTSRWFRHADKQSGRSLEPLVVLTSTLLCGETEGKNGKPTQDSRCPGRPDNWLRLGYLIAIPLVLCCACFAVLSE